MSYNERILYLWIDDIRPMDFSIQAYHDYECTAVKSVNQAKIIIELAEKNGYARFYIDLDHDLGDFAFDGGDGYELVKWMVETGRTTKDYWIYCHSMNPVGKSNIEHLRNRYFAPFDSKYFYMEEE